MAARCSVSVVMGSKSDFPIMRQAVQFLRQHRIPHEVLIVSAHRTPEWLFRFAKSAERRKIQVVIAGAGGSAHLPGMIAALTAVPVIGVPMPTAAWKGLDSLLSIAQMPKGIPVATTPIGRARLAAEAAVRIVRSSV